MKKVFRVCVALILIFIFCMKPEARCISCRDCYVKLGQTKVIYSSKKANWSISNDNVEVKEESDNRLKIKANKVGVTKVIAKTSYGEFSCTIHVEDTLNDVKKYLDFDYMKDGKGNIVLSFMNHAKKDLRVNVQLRVNNSKTVFLELKRIPAGKAVKKRMKASNVYIEKIGVFYAINE